jgi:hypothetical protein
LGKGVKNMQKRNVLAWCFGSVLALLLVTLIGLPAFGQAKDEKKPSISITITSVPTDPPGENMASEPIKGTTSGCNPNEHKVVIYARGGPTWYVQPYVASPPTDIGADGKWESETHGGTDFAALVVKSSYEAKATLGTIPAVDGNIILAKATKKPEKKTDK